MNSVILLGRITKDPELKQTKQGKAYCLFTIAVDRGNDKADFIPCICWNETAQNLSKYVQKGRQLLVQGKLQSGRYQDDTGTTHYTLDVFVFRIEFLAKPRSQQQYEDFIPVEMDNDELPF